MKTKGYKSYRGRKAWRVRRTVYRVLCVLGFLIVLCSAGWSDAGAPLLPCLGWAALGLLMFALFGHLGDLMI